MKDTDDVDVATWFYEISYPVMLEEKYANLAGILRVHIDDRDADVF